MLRSSTFNRTWVFQTPWVFVQVQGLPILETTLSFLANDVLATVHPNPMPSAKPLVSTTWTWLHKMIGRLMGHKLLLFVSKHSSWWIQIPSNCNECLKENLWSWQFKRHPESWLLAILSSLSLSQKPYILPQCQQLHPVHSRSICGCENQPSPLVR